MLYAAGSAGTRASCAMLMGWWSFAILGSWHSLSVVSVLPCHYVPCPCLVLEVRIIVFLSHPFTPCPHLASDGRRDRDFVGGVCAAAVEHNREGVPKQALGLRPQLRDLCVYMPPSALRPMQWTVLWYAVGNDGVEFRAVAGSFSASVAWCPTGG